MHDEIPIFSPVEFVAVFNQTLEYAFPVVKIIGELSSFNISKNRWVYADLKDDEAKLRLFGTIFQMPGPLEDGMMLEVIGEPRLHPQFGFSISIKSMRPIGEGSIKKAANLLQTKLEAEGLFAPERKRYVAQAPERVGLIASEQSAAYGDFVKILNARWSGVEVELFDAQVQGDLAVESIVNGLQYFNQTAEGPEVLVIIRGGGSADDLAAFSTEQVTRAVAASRIPTLVAVGHEIDVSLAELAADVRASTPSNAAELLFPDKKQVVESLKSQAKNLSSSVGQKLELKESKLQESGGVLSRQVSQILERKSVELAQYAAILESIHPKATLKRGYALVRSQGKLISSVKATHSNQQLLITFKDGDTKAKVQ